MTKKTKILFASRAMESPPQEGGFVLLKDMALNFSNKSVVPHMLSMSSRKIGNIHPVRVFTALGWDKVVKTQYLMAILLYSARFDIVHTAHIPTMFNTRIMHKITKFAHIRGTRFVQTVTGLPKLRDDQLSKLFWGDYLVFQSPSAMERARKITDRPMKLIVPWPSDKRVGFDAKRRSKTRKKLGVDPDTKLVVFPGEFKRMGIDASFTECVKTFVKKFPNSQFILACRFDFDHIGESIASKFDSNVTSVGSTTNVIELMEASDLVIFPARKMHNKFHPPLIITEALALGAQVLVSDVVDIDPAVSPNLNRLDSPVSWSEFGNKMADIIKETNGKTATRNGFKKMVHSYESVYDSLLSD